MDKFNKKREKKQTSILGHFQQTGHQSTTHRSSSGNTPDHFCKEAGRVFVYPNDFEVRPYQLNAVRKCIISNTLVCFPTGAGKTLVAAVLARNVLDWFPSGQGRVVYFSLFSLFFLYFTTEGG